MSIAERFINKTEIKPEKEDVTDENPSFGNNVLPNEFEKFSGELFEKIANIPYWCEFDCQKQYTLIEKFLLNKGVVSPSIFAKLLQTSMLGFGIFDKYLKNPDIEGIIYEKNTPFHYLKNGILISVKEYFSTDKINLVYKNIMNIAGFDGKSLHYNFRIYNYWIQIINSENELQKLCIYKITDNFLRNEIEKYNIHTLKI